MENYDVFKKLLGNISPIGSTGEDNLRFKNLEETIDIVDKLLFDIGVVAQNSNRIEYSMKRAGLLAEKFLEEIGKQ